MKQIASAFLLLVAGIFAGESWKGTQPFTSFSYPAFHYKAPVIVDLDRKAAAAFASAEELEKSGDMARMKETLVGVVRDFPASQTAAKAAFKAASFEALLANHEEAIPLLLYVVNSHYNSPYGPEAALLLARSFHEFGDGRLAKRIATIVLAHAVGKRIDASWALASKQFLDEIASVAKH